MASEERLECLEFRFRVGHTAPDPHRAPPYRKKLPNKAGLELREQGEKARLVE